MTEEKIERVIIADDHSLFRDGISSLLEAAGYKVVAQVGSGASVIEAAEKFEPDLVLLDINMPEMGGLQALRELKNAHPDMKVVMLTVSDDDQDLFTAIKAGAEGYLLKDLESREFLRILKGMQHGEAAITRKTAARLMVGFQQAASQKNGPIESLTEREVQLLRLVGKGLSNREVAEQLFISQNTVKYHLRNILQKLNASNRTEAVSYAMRHGFFNGETE